jgi:hypothetical protein
MLPILYVLPVVVAAAPADAAALAVRIDGFTQKHWQTLDVKPAGPADDATFLRRLTLDLAGRTPTAAETRAFVADTGSDKRVRAAARLLGGAEYPRQLGRIIDEIVQEKYAGGEFLDYARAAAAAHTPWDRLFREVMLGPWDTPAARNADKFLARRAKDLDELTNDTARVFFGVNVSCAKCHDHPLVEDWKQDHYFGMASFLVRTHEAAKKQKRGKNLQVGEDPAGEVQYVTTKGERRTAKLMFLSGKVVAVAAKDSKEKDKPAFSPREALVRVGLENKTFFSRAIVNRLWAYLLGRGLVMPLDQLHSANDPAIPELLEWLADDLAAHGYDLDRTVAGIVQSRVYALASTRGSASADDDPEGKAFDRAALRPLSPTQLAASLVLAAGDGHYDATGDNAAVAARHAALEAKAAPLARSGLLDRRTERFQSSAGEALYVSNHEDVQKLFRPEPGNLVARMAALADAGAAVDEAYWSVLSRPADKEERAHLAKWLAARPDRAKACGLLAWSLATSAEFRFNH